jgi:hypothetical protein
MKKKWPVAEIVVATLALAAGIGVYAWAHNDQGPLEESKARGAEVVRALTAYHQDHGTYPEELDALVPDYLSEVPQPTWGLERWRYRRFTPDMVTGAAVMAPADPAAAAGTAPAATAPPTITPADEVYFQLSVARNTSGYPILYYDLKARRWVLNN